VKAVREVKASRVVDLCARDDDARGRLSSAHRHVRGGRQFSTSSSARRHIRGGRPVFELEVAEPEIVEGCFARVRPRATSIKCWCVFLPRAAVARVFPDRLPKLSGMRFGASASTSLVDRERFDANHSVFTRVFSKSRQLSLERSMRRIETSRWPCSGTRSGHGWRLNALWL
jgi:hypothetical protein